MYLKVTTILVPKCYTTHVTQQRTTKAKTVYTVHTFLLIDEYIRNK
jgi:hypothetical protein